jgi:hypothetical protein
MSAGCETAFVRCALRADAGTMQVVHDGIVSEYSVTRMRASWSSFNFVFCIPDKPNLVLRVSKEALCESEHGMYLDEIAVTREMAALGLAPRVMGTAFVRIGNGAVRVPESGESGVHVGMLMEKYDLSLGAVQTDATLATEVFLRFRGEEAVAALYYAASKHIGCSDAKPGNVVARRDASGISLALIDFDTRFCARAPHCATFGASQASALDAIECALDAFGNGTVRDVAALRAALMLFVYCFISAWQAQRDSRTKGAFYLFPYARIAETLVRHARALFVLVILEESGDATYALVGGAVRAGAVRAAQAPPQEFQWTVRGVISAYSEHTHTVQTALDLIARAAASAPSRLLRACVDGDDYFPDAFLRGASALATRGPTPCGPMPRGSDALLAEIRAWAMQGEPPRAFRRM